MNVPREILELIDPQNLNLFKTCKLFYCYVDLYYDNYLVNYETNKMVRNVIKKKDKTLCNFIIKDYNYIREYLFENIRHIKDGPYDTLDFTKFRNIKSLTVHRYEGVSYETLPKSLTTLSIGLSRSANTIKIPDNVRKLTVFTSSPNKDGIKPIIKLPTKLKYLNLSWNIHCVPTLPDTLKYLFVYSDFNSPLEMLPDTLKSLVVQTDRCMPNNLPAKLQYLKLGNGFNKSLDVHNLMHLQKLIIGYTFNQSLDLPNNLKYLDLKSCFNYNYPLNLPNSLEYLTLGSGFNHPLILPDNLKYLSLGYKFNQRLTFPDSLLHLEMSNLDQLSILPKNLNHLVLENNFNELLCLPDSLTYLDVGNSFNKYLILPSKLIYLNLGNNFNKKIDFPESLIELHLGYNYKQTLDNLPGKLYTLVLEDYDIKINREQLPKSLRYVTNNKKFSHVWGETKEKPIDLQEEYNSYFT